MREDSKYILSSLDNALSVLNLFISHSELSAMEISELSGINKSTVFRLLVTLESRGFIARNEKGKYKLGLKLFTLGQLVHSRMGLIAIIHPYLEKLAETTGESCHLCVIEDSTHIVFLDKVVGNQWLKMDTPLGFRQYAHLTGTGKAILAFESEQMINQYIKSAEFVPQTNYSIRNAKDFLKVLDEIRTNGYSCDSEECEIGLTCYAVPILDASGAPIAAISSSGPSTRMESKKLLHIRLLKEIANQIHNTLT